MQLEQCKQKKQEQWTEKKKTIEQILSTSRKDCELLSFDTKEKLVCSVIRIRKKSSLFRQNSDKINLYLCFKIQKSSLEYSAQAQVFHCKLRHQGCSSGQNASLLPKNSGTKTAVLPGIEQVWQFPVAFLTPLSL